MRLFADVRLAHLSDRSLHVRCLINLIPCILETSGLSCTEQFEVPFETPEKQSS